MFSREELGDLGALGTRSGSPSSLAAKQTHPIRGNSGLTLPPSNWARIRKSSFCGCAQRRPRTAPPPRRGEVETAVDRFRRPRQERLQQDRGFPQRFDQIEQDLFGRVLSVFTRFHGSLRSAYWFTPG